MDRRGWRTRCKGDETETQGRGAKKKPMPKVQQAIVHSNTYQTTAAADQVDGEIIKKTVSEMNRPKAQHSPQNRRHRITIIIIIIIIQCLNTHTEALAFGLADQGPLQPRSVTHQRSTTSCSTNQ